MTLSGVNIGVSDGALGTIPDSNENVIVVVGYSTAGTAYTPVSNSDPDAAKANLSGGPLCESVAHILEATQKSPVWAIPVTSDVAGSLTSPFAKTGTGPDVTSASAPNDAYGLKIKIILGGAVATATFQYSTDGGDTWSDTIVTAATYVIPGTGVTVAFAAGTYVAADVYSTTCVAPGYSITNLGTALDALIASSVNPSLLLVQGTPVDHTASAAWAAAIQAKLATAAGKYQYMRAFCECSDSTDANLLSAFASTEAQRVFACPGFVELASSITLGRVYKRSASWSVAARAAKNKVHRHLGAVADGGLYNVRSLLRDERATAGLNGHRFTVLKTIPGVVGFYVEQPDGLALAGSDYVKLHNCRVIDKACRVAYAAMMPYVNRDWDLRANGTIAEDEALGMESNVLQILKNALLPDKNCSAVQFVVSRTDDILSTETVHVKVRVQPKGYSKFIEVDIGFTKTVAAAA